MHSLSGRNMFHHGMEVQFRRSSGRKVIEHDWIKLFDFPISDITGVNVEHMPDSYILPLLAPLHSIKRSLYFSFGR